jgi:hypothetical protein
MSINIDVVSNEFDSPMAILEIALSFWLLFKGLQAPSHALSPTEN